MLHEDLRPWLSLILCRFVSTTKIFRANQVVVQLLLGTRSRQKMHRLPITIDVVDCRAFLVWNVCRGGVLCVKAFVTLGDPSDFSREYHFVDAGCVVFRYPSLNVKTDFIQK